MGYEQERVENGLFVALASKTVGSAQFFTTLCRSQCLRRGASCFVGPW